LKAFRDLLDIFVYKTPITRAWAPAIRGRRSGTVGLPPALLQRLRKWDPDDPKIFGADRMQFTRKGIDVPCGVTNREGGHALSVL
jgi:hypothetical protein